MSAVKRFSRRVMRFCNKILKYHQEVAQEKCDADACGGVLLVSARQFLFDNNVFRYRFADNVLGVSVSARSYTPDRAHRVVLSLWDEPALRDFVLEEATLRGIAVIQNVILNRVWIRNTRSVEYLLRLHYRLFQSIDISLTREAKEMAQGVFDFLPLPNRRQDKEKINLAMREFGFLADWVMDHTEHGDVLAKLIEKNSVQVNH